MSKQPVSLKLMYRNLLVRSKNLIISPSVEWTNILNEKTTSNEILSLFNLPLIGICTATTFLGYLFNHQEILIDLALKQAAFAFSAFFFGLYASFFILLKIMPRFYDSTSKELAFKLIAYPSVMIYLIHLMNTLFPETYFLRILSLYSGYIIWEGLSILTFKKRELQIFLTAIITFSILMMPWIISQLFYRLTAL
ncbi:hypothetical protein DMA11_01150 [Marinilabiliaceae bacterium JC017]|nr:hypothetical protein DMA11_01150 [Marinilabiliaceae bacterium JC017]